MSLVDSTPQMVSRVYKAMDERISSVRSWIDRPLTLADKLLLGHLENSDQIQINPGETYVHLKPDRVALQDVLGQTVMLNFMQTKKLKTAVPTTVHCDHLIQARSEGSSDLLDSVQENAEVYDFLQSAASKFGVGFWKPGAGIIHQVVLERYAFPGCLIIGTDSHTPNAGGIGACAVGVGGSDAVEVMAGLSWQTLYPKRIGVRLVGELRDWTAPKDVILYLAGVLTVSGATNCIIEYFGPGTQSISCTGKATITNMGAELGATTSVFPYDNRIEKYLNATERSDIANLSNEFKDYLSADPEVENNPEKYFDRVVEVNLDTLEPHIVGPHSPDRARPISKMVNEIEDGQNGFIDQVDTALIGSCTNSSYEDMHKASDIAKQAMNHGLKINSTLMVTPGSEQIRSTIKRDGQLGSLESIGAKVLANACGPCIGQWKREKVLDGIPNTIVTSYNRNFPRRNDGRSETMNFIASPEIVVSLALAGRLGFNPISDELIGEDGKPFKLMPPINPPEIPRDGFISDVEYYVEPSEDGSNIKVDVDPNSDRLQILTPFDAWDGKDFDRLPLLIKVKGKCTTDHISPAGPWLRYRGHLDKFSDNMFMGAINAFGNQTGKGFNQLTGKNSEMISKIARNYKSEGLRWVVVGDFNYGEGSSREHAALSPRLLGGAAVIARSFARIHESNLKKQGILALTFENSDDYEKILESDSISIVGLNNFSEGKPIKCIIHHSDDSLEEICVTHSFSSNQIEWFKSGAALNLLHNK